MSDRVHAKVQAQQKTLSGSSPKGSLLQRTCACGQHTLAGGECSTCRSEQSTLLRSQRVFESPSAPVAVPGSSPAQENAASFNAAFDRASRFGYDFSQIPIHSPAAGVIQTKLAINQPGDQYEQEADGLSEHVMRMPEPQLQRACACGGACPKCQTEQPGREHESLQTKRVQASDTGQMAVPPIVHEVLRSPGQPLDPVTRAFIELRFGYNFSRVRVHCGAAAEQEDHEKDRLRDDLFKDKLLPEGESLRGNGFDVDHVLEKQFGGEDAFHSLWPADYQENQLAGGLFKIDIQHYRDTIEGGNIAGRWFEIVAFRRASTVV